MSVENSSDTQWYSCQNELGLLHVGVVIGAERMDAMSGPLRVLRQAALLGEVELVLQALEVWQQIKLDLQPIDNNIHQNSTAQSNCIKLSIIPQNTKSVFPVRVEFPLNALRQIKPATAELLKIFSLQWSGLEAELVVDRFDLSEQERAGLEYGALVLLPRSFSENWITEICLPIACGESVVSVFDFPSLKLEPTGAKQLSGHASAGYTVKMSASVPVTPDTLLGFENGCGIELDAAATNLNAELLHDNQMIVSGCLGPVGAGYALFINKVGILSTETTAY